MQKRKYLATCILIILSTLLLIGCKKKTKTEDVVFTAEVITVEENTLLVRPEENTYEDIEYTQMYVPVDTTIRDTKGEFVTSKELTPGTRVQITYDGVTDDSDPSLILNCYEIRILNDTPEK